MKTILNNHVIYPELSYKIMGAAMDVHNQLGPGWDEDAYHSALVHALRKSGLKAESKLRGVLIYLMVLSRTLDLTSFI